MGTATKEINVPVKIKVEAKPIMEQTYDRTMKSIFKLAFHKLVENLVSVKVWTIFALLGVTTFLCYVGKITGAEFITINGGVITTVYALREGFKVAKIKKLTNGEVKDINV